MHEDGARQRVAEVLAYENRLEKQRLEADAAIDKALKDWADGKITAKEADVIIEEKLALREKIEPAGSCLAITMARDDGYFLAAMKDSSVRSKLQNVANLDRTVETATENTNAIFDKAIADFEAGRITKEEASKTIDAALKAKESLDTAGSCRALTAARAEGLFINRHK